jgi:hypothetical protein
MTRWPLPHLLLASLVGLACAAGNNRPSQPPAPPLTDPFTAPVSSAVMQKVAACKKPEDCGPPAAGIAWECRLGACTPTSPATNAPPPEPQPVEAGQSGMGGTGKGGHGGGDYGRSRTRWYRENGSEIGRLRY